MEATIEQIINAFVVLHFIGLASLLGGFLVQMKSLRSGTAKIIPAMVHGAWTMLITGLVLVGMHEWLGSMTEGHEINNMKIGVKLIVVLVILILVLLSRKKDLVKTGLFGAIGALTLLNIVLAVFW
ncbi:MAG: hypothetical protein RLZZ579_1066 [Actinomycetota bacterium]